MDGERPETPSEAGTDGGALEDDRVVQRTLLWLVVVPFTWPMWYTLRRRRPDLAAPIGWAAWFNVAQSVVVVAVVAFACWAVVALPGLVDRVVSGWFVK